MEKARHRRSRSATSVEGNLHVRQQKVVQSLVSDSQSYSEGISKDDLITTHFNQSSVKRGSGTPIKKLLAEEMAKEGQAKRRSPNVIARLMGLDGLPSPQHGQRQPKKLFDKHQQRNTARNIHENEHLYEDRSSRRSSVDQKDFKDVFEDLEASHVTNCRYSSKWSMESGFTNPEMEIIQQKFMDAKRLSCSTELQVSKEFDDTLEMLDSNKDLLLRYLQQPDSLFIKPLHDLQAASSRSCYDHMASSEATNSRAKGWKSERDSACKYNISSHPKREDGLLLQSQSRHSSYGPCNPSRNYLDVKSEGNVLPTRIVVLKPNICKTSNSIASVSSPESSHVHPSSYRKNLERRNVKSDEVASWKKKTSSSGVISSSPKLQEDRAFAREVTRRMRENFESFGGGLNTLSHSGARGYAGDESSCDAYESDSSSDSGGKTVSPSDAFDWNNWYTRSSSGRNESLVSKEAKKRMSERWKMTHRCQDVESFGKGSTLGEMLAVPDRETGSTLDVATTLDRDNKKFPCHDNFSGCDSPLGISSRDGWKDECLKNSSRSRSLPPLFSSRSYRSDGRREALVITNETKCLRRSKARKGYLSQKEDYSSGDRSSSRKPHPCSDDAHSSPDVNSASLLQADISHDKGDRQEKDMILSQVPATSGSCTTSISDAVPDAKRERFTLSLDRPVDFQFEHSDNMTENYSSNAHEETMWQQELPVSQSAGVPSPFPCPGPEPESSESSKEADHPSPVSVLEVSFTEDVSSSSDCFERVNAELHELRMQLQLLKMESGGYADTPILSSSNEQVLQQSETVPEGGCLFGDRSWESCYIDEVLFNAGLEEINPDTFVTTWHSAESPLDPWIFDNLEKNYGGETTRLKFERKLLFDRINLALLQMFKHHINPGPWVKPLKCAVNLNWQKYQVKDALLSFLTNQVIEVNGKNVEKLLDREMYWLGFRDDIDIVGKQIEKMLIDDLIGELLTM